MEPRGELSSTGFVLANEGSEYVVLQPTENADSFTVTLAPGTYEAEWFSVDARKTRQGERVSVDTAGAFPFSLPFGTSAPAVLVLRRA